MNPGDLKFIPACKLCFQKIENYYPPYFMCHNHNHGAGYSGKPYFRADHKYTDEGELIEVKLILWKAKIRFPFCLYMDLVNKTSKVTHYVREGADPTIVALDYLPDVTFDNLVPFIDRVIKLKAFG